MAVALKRFVARCRAFLQPGRADRELEREIDAHLAMLADRYVGEGLTPGQAASRARRTLGVDRTKDLHHDARSFRWLEDARRDLVHAGRMCGRSPGFTALAVLTLALGIGSVTVIYSVIHNVLLDPLPYPASDRFVNVVVESSSGGRQLLAPAEFAAYRDHTTVFEGVVGTRGEGMLLVDRDRVELVRGVWVSPNFFEFMGLPPLAGRALGPADCRPDAPPVAVLRHRAWVNFFGADPNVVGRTIILNGEPRTVVGVMPARFTWHAADVWIPTPSDAIGLPTDGGPRGFQARLRPGVTAAQAEVQLATVAAGRAREHPGDYPPGARIRVPNVIDQVVGDFKGVLFSLLAAVVLLMLIACCNVANMLLARATAREREMTLRAALGAGQGRLVRQLLTESALLCVAGAGAGILLAHAGLRALIPLLPEGPLPGEIEITLNGPVLLAAVVTAVASGLLFGLAPALFSARATLVESLRSGGRGVGDGRRNLRGALVVAEIALAVVLVLSSTLLLRTFLALSAQDLGFDPRNVVSVRPSFPQGTYGDASQRRRFYRAWLERIAAIPGVERAAAVSGTPPFGGYPSTADVIGRPTAAPSAVLLQFCTDRFFDTLGVRVVRGRGFDDDRLETPRAVAVVNEAFVRALLEGIEPLGRRVRVSVPQRIGAPTVPTEVEIIGVVADVRNRGIKDPPSPELYLPGLSPGTPAVLVRSAGGATVIGAMRNELRQLDRQVALRESSMDDLLNRNFYAQPRFSVVVVAVFSVAGMLLVAIGVYSVLAYTVAQQTREIAVRLALGARRVEVCLMVLKWAATLVAIGVTVGLAATVGTTRLLADQLWQTPTFDLPSLVATVTIVVLVALAACLVPTRRAFGVEPMTVLRQD